MKVAITGNIGSGKSTALHFFEMIGAPVFSADVSGHNALNRPEAIVALRQTFGDDIFDENNLPNRKKIGAIVFFDHRKLLQLNQIVHPIIKNDVQQWMEQQDPEAPYILCEAAVLFEAHFETLFDKIITISTPENIRIQRVMKRDHLSYEQALQRIQSQLPEEIKIQKSDFCILNDDIHSIIPQILEIHRQLGGKL